jgi:hypothetical protein
MVPGRRNWEVKAMTDVDDAVEHDKGRSDFASDQEYADYLSLEIINQVDEDAWMLPAEMAYHVERYGVAGCEKIIEHMADWAKGLVRKIDALSAMAKAGAIQAGWRNELDRCP